MLGTATAKHRYHGLQSICSGGLILAHNMNMVPEYVKTVTSNPGLETVFYMEGNQLGVTLKKR